MRFKDRSDAARLLAAALEKYKGTHPLVLAIPRGAVPMGRILAEALDGDLDVILIRKLGAPFNPELAVGSIAESGWSYIAPYAARLGADMRYLEAEKSAQLAVIQRRRAMYTPKRAPCDVRERVVIVVDDGLATGASMMAALHAIRPLHPKRLVCAVPVAAPDSLESIRPLADDVVCLYAPPGFRAVGLYYDAFSQVEDAQVCACLESLSQTDDD
ncbi:phosphoribosyltransferase [Ralstonia solanacearum]|uniref:phosphoribosyltransferase n=1 Tax=Ralstonia solanacearum TaxID=305 RepID=UPI0005C5090E|nr:phosphoribosyltransferase family protein [Ralstonia solanacearum]MBB6593110.1 phosphoribosyltransferase [Ralstonia solanacearum]MBB6597337.1 phosphoribosyltransferase [Ralstonia solanacearum]MDB0509606.1 phosphoribosyltransferase [Ralstonia solanacearum]MDB0515538.1 phosphoribosyltransferase [Ralstonia solanacearum]MDB0539965.1 phosphoribosyltransferase [Ralstonia solanacearum]